MATPKTKKTAKNDALGEAAAAVLASAQTAGDPPAEAEADVDWDFVEYDPTDPTPYLKKAGVTVAPDMDLRWCDSDPRMWNKRSAQGWDPVGGGKVRRGSTLLCQMPKARLEAKRRRIRQIQEDKKTAPMRRLHQEVERISPRGVSLFEGDRSLRDGLD